MTKGSCGSHGPGTGPNGKPLGGWMLASARQLINPDGPQP